MSNSPFRKNKEIAFFNACFDKNYLKNLISWFISQSGEKKTVDFLETLKQLGFHNATLAGISLGLDDLQIPPEKSILISQARADVSFVEQQNRSGNLTSVEKSQQMISTWNQTSEFLRKTAVQNFKNTNKVNPVFMMAFSGARGNISQVRQLVGMRGLMADPQGAIVEFPIQSNFREGLTLTEYLISCFGARKGLVDTALRTATSGYLTRRLVDAAQHVIISIKDCKTYQGLRLRSKNLEPHLIGRVLSHDLVVDSKFHLKKNQIISSALAKIISKHVHEVYVRSPLTCQAENTICQYCYGWNLAHGKLVNIGDAVGVIAAQSIGEPGTQLTMRTFHTGGVGVFSEQAMKYFRAPYDGVIEYTEGLPGHFVRTPNGKIVYMLRTTSTKNYTYVLKLKPESFQKQKNKSVSKTELSSVFANRINVSIWKIKQTETETKQLEYSLNRQDLPPGSILLVRQGERVKIGQVIAQVPLVKRSKQKLPESTSPVFSPLSGEVLLESMLILKQRQFAANPKKKRVPKKLDIDEKKTKKKKQLGPFMRTLVGVGAFWVLSSQNQQEFDSVETLLRPGDLVSTKTLLFQYDFYVYQRSIFNILENTFCSGVNAVYLPVQKINFHKRTYSLVVKNFLNQNLNKQKFITKNSHYSTKQLLFFTKKRRSNFLVWVPTGSFLQTSGYCFNSRFYSEIKPLKNKLFCLESKERKLINQSLSFDKKSHKDRKNLSLSTRWFFGNLFYLKKQIKKFKNNKLNFALNFQNKTNYYIVNLKKGKPYSLFEYKSPYQIKKNFTCYNSFAQFYQKSSQSFDKNTNKFFVKKSKIKIKFSSSLQKNYILLPSFTENSNFLKHALHKVKSPFFSYYIDVPSFIEEKKGWVFVPIESNHLKKIYQQTSKKTFLSNKKYAGNLLGWEQTKIFNNFLFPNCKIVLEAISLNHIGFVKSFSNQIRFEKQKLFLDYSENTWYSKNLFLTLNNFLSIKDQGKVSNIFGKILTTNTQKNQLKCYIYYRFKKREFFENKSNFQNVPIYRPFQISTTLKIQNKLSYLLLISKVNEFFVPKKQDSIRQWNDLKIINPTFIITSPVVNKQNSTFFRKEPNTSKKIKLVVSDSKGWFSQKNFYKLLINLNSSITYKKVNPSFLLGKQIKNSKISFTGFQLFHYNVLLMPTAPLLDFEFFQNNWLIPGRKLTTCFIPIKEIGEFRSLNYKENTTIACILTKQDLRTVTVSKVFENRNVLQNLNKNNQIKVGIFIRSGTEIFSGIALSTGGMILTKTLNQFTVRSGIAFLASSRGICHVFHQDLIQKNHLLVTLKSKRFQTEDIVQGIPKIEQLFEARESQGGIPIQNSTHTRLKNYFVKFLSRKKCAMEPDYITIAFAVTTSFKKIQFFLVQSIFDAYASQGVKISQKHIEIIVRQMTRRIRVLDGGDSGLLPGEFCLFTRIQNLNNKLFFHEKRTVIYQPILLGITKSVLQSESFLLAASFQEVSRVLVRSALTRKTDFLRGLHENVILGQLIPAGTGLILKRKRVGKKSNNLSSRNIKVLHR